MTLAAFAVCAAPASAEATPDAARALGPARIGEPHPALELDTVEGTLVNEGRIAARPLIVEFFATWCEPCRRALGDLTSVRRRPGTTIQVVLVNLGEPADVVQHWMATADLPPETIVAVDPNGIAARRWGARRLPTTFVVDAAGVVRHINRGWGPGYRDRMLRWLRDIGGSAIPTRSSP